MTTKVQLNRIRILIEELEKLRAQHGRGIKFDMGLYVSTLNFDLPTAIKNPCGTYACLVGKAGLIPRIRRMGFRWTQAAGGGYDFRYKKCRGSDAIRTFFGDAVSAEIFHGPGMDRISTLFQGIKALKKFVANATA